MLYSFRQLKAVYAVDINRVHPGYSMTYNCEIHISASFRGDTGFFTFGKKDRVLINGEKPEQAADVMMRRLGDILYPVTFLVTASGTVTGIDNYEEVRDRWSAESRKLLKEMNDSPTAERYISSSWSNVKSEDKLLRSLFRDSFTRLFFTVHGEKTDLVVDNFPRAGYSAAFKLQEIDRQGDKRILSDASGQGELSYERSGEGVLLALHASLLTADEKGGHRFDAKIKRHG